MLNVRWTDFVNKRYVAILAIAVALGTCSGTLVFAASPEVLNETTPVMVRVQVFNQTDQRPLPEKSELWFRDYGSWWLKAATELGQATENLGRREVGHKESFELYPDGRAAQKILVPFMMTEDMHPDGSPKDTIVITLGDEEITVAGLPLKAATGERTMTVKRKP